MKEEVHIYTLDGETGGKMEIKLFKNVKNSSDLKKKVIEGSLKCCLIKATLIYDPFQIVVAANKALLSMKMNSMTTRSVYSEILFNLSLSKNITQSLQTFGIDDKDVNLIVVFLECDGLDNCKSTVVNSIQGELCSIDELETMRNMKSIEKLYKLSNINKSDITNAIVSKIATKSFISH